jgi:four helix bundle protein
MGAKITSFKDLIVWQKAFEVGKRLHKMASTFPAIERFALTSQVHRGAIGLASNIAEGYGRGSRADYLRYLKITRGSLFELQTQVLFAVDFGYISKRGFDSIMSELDECARILAGLIRKLES